jgi:ribonuclease P protein component
MTTIFRFERVWKSDEAHISAESAPPQKDSRIQTPNEDAGRAERLEETASQGAKAPDRLIEENRILGSGRLGRSERLTSGAEFQAVFRHGKRIERPSLILIWRDRERSRRAGFAVSRQIGSAVSRNRARRRIREAYRVSQLLGPDRGDLVIVARPGVLTMSFSVIVKDVQNALRAVWVAPGGGSA